MSPTLLQIIGTILFGLAVIHIFSVKKFEQLAYKHPIGSVKGNFFHLLGEFEVVFGMWAGIFIIIYGLMKGFIVEDGNHNISAGVVYYLHNLDYTEAVFVFVIMCVAGTRPIILFAEKIILSASSFLPLPRRMSFYISTLIVGPLLGSFITEPAAMTITSLILLDYFYNSDMSNRFKYATLGLLFVNVSIGGTLTNFAAPPVLMVAKKWGWSNGFMITHIGYKAAIAITISTIVTALVFQKELTGKLKIKQRHDNYMKPAWWITLIHFIFLFLVVYTAHHTQFFLGLFLFFLGFTTVTKEYQDKIKLRESLLVGFFLAGVVTLGSVQEWWLQPLLTKFNNGTLYFGSLGLTAFFDNAGLTYLGSLIELSDAAKYYLVAGAVTGGGLTIIANAPNPAGAGILKGRFGKEGISPLGIFLGAFCPTIVTVILFYTLPSL